MTNWLVCANVPNLGRRFTNLSPIPSSTRDFQSKRKLHLHRYTVAHFLLEFLALARKLLGNCRANLNGWTDWTHELRAYLPLSPIKKGTITDSSPTTNWFGHFCLWRVGAIYRHTTFFPFVRASTWRLGWTFGDRFGSIRSESFVSSRGNVWLVTIVPLWYDLVMTRRIRIKLNISLFLRHTDLSLGSLANPLSSDCQISTNLHETRTRPCLQTRHLSSLTYHYTTATLLT